MRFSRRRRPELPPSSVTVTIAARSVMGRSGVGCSSRRRTTCSLSPRRIVERPVPPPRATMRKPWARVFEVVERFFTSVSQNPAGPYYRKVCDAEYRAQQYWSDGACLSLRFDAQRSLEGCVEILKSAQSLASG